MTLRVSGTGEEGPETDEDTVQVQVTNGAPVIDEVTVGTPRTEGAAAASRAARPRRPSRLSASLGARGRIIGVRAAATGLTAR